MFRAEIAPDEAEDAGGLDARQGRQRSMAQFLPEQIKGFYGSSVSALAEGFAVGALVLGGVVLVGAHQDLVQGAVVLLAAVVGALLHGAGNAVVGRAGMAGIVGVHENASCK